MGGGAVGSALAGTILPNETSCLPALYHTARSHVLLPPGPQVKVPLWGEEGKRMGHLHLGLLMEKEALPGEAVGEWRGWGVGAGASKVGAGGRQTRWHRLGMQGVNARLAGKETAIGIGPA